MAASIWRCPDAGVHQNTCMTVEVEREDAIIDSFHAFGLDDRLLRVLTRQGITKPTLIQEKAIPLALSGKDILAKARTGSGKTLAYLLPSLHQLLQQQCTSPQGHQHPHTRPNQGAFSSSDRVCQGVVAVL